MRDKIKATVKDSIQPAPIPHLVFGMDRSGSMITGSKHGFNAPFTSTIKSYKVHGYGVTYFKNPGCRALCIEEAYKYIVEDQLKLAMPALVSVYTHDDVLTPLVVRKPLVEAATITIDPQGDNAMYRCFMELVRKHENEENVMLTFMADGEDRFETHWKREMREVVERLTKEKGWFFAYVGVGGVTSGREGCASTFGIPEANAIYSKDGEAAVKEAAVRLSQMATAFRTGAR